MAKSQNQKLKIVYLQKILLEETDSEHPMTMKQLQEALGRYGIEAERKSLYDDMELLKNFGLDIVKEIRERNHYYYVANREFSMSELTMLVDSTLSARALTEEKAKELVDKLAKQASRHEAKLLERKVMVMGRARSLNESIFTNVDFIHQAIQCDQQISFHYYEWNGKKELVERANGAKTRISPWMLVWDNENYYLAAYDGEKREIRHYRIDKIRKIKMRKEKREGREQFEKLSQKEYSNRHFQMYDGEEEAVTVQCNKAILGVLLDRFGTDITVRESSHEGLFEVRFLVGISNVFLGWLIGLGSGVKLLRPQSVVDRMTTLAMQTVLETKRGGIKNIIFDLGMVLVDFRYREYMEELGFSKEEEDFFTDNIILSKIWDKLDIGLLPQDEIVEQWKQEFPQIKDKIDLFFADTTRLVLSYPDSIAWIESYRKLGYKVYLLTNYPDQMFELHKKGSFDFFPYVDGYVVSAKEHTSKPEPAIYQCLLDRYSLRPEECVFVDDREVNIRGAEAMGIHGILCKDRSQAQKELSYFIAANGAYTDVQ